MGAWLALLFFGYADQASASAWLEGGRLAARLQTPVSVTWSGKPLREALTALSEWHRVSVVLDRRVDPGQPVELALEDVALGDAFRRLAAAVGCGYSQFGPVAYVGPPEVAARLRTLSAVLEQTAADLPPQVHQRISQQSTLSWPNLATPRGLLEDLAASSGIDLTGLDQVPHDLWAAGDLAPLSWLDRVLIVSVQFDLWPQPVEDMQAFSLSRIPQQVLLERSYPGGSRARALAERWQALAPECQIEVRGRRIVVRGLLEDHERLRAGPSAAPRKPPRSAPQSARVKRLNVRGKLSDVLNAMASSYGLSLDMDRAALAAAGIPADTLVELKIEEASLDEALHRLLDPLRISFRLDETSLHVFPSSDK